MFTPSQRALRAVRRVAKASNKPVSSIVSEQIDVLTEHLENLARVLEYAAQLRLREPQVVKNAAVRALEAFDQMLPILDRSKDELDSVFEGAVSDLADQLSLLDDEPPSSNTGATSHPGPPPPNVPVRPANG
jgi:DNA integrity scanning protein DisA with diadenylate cyclase activity